MRQLPPLAAVRVFEAAARHENFTRAAEELGMTQAAVSYQIQILEERLGLPLFVREKRRVTLTDTGRRIAPQVAAAFDGLDAAFGMARTANASVLMVSAAATFAANWLAPRIGAFQMAHPELAVRVQGSNALTDFAREEVDVAVRAGVGPWPGLTRHFLMRTAVAALASPDYLARHPPVGGPDDILQRDRISSDDDWWRLWCAGIGGTGAMTPGGGVRMDSQLMEGRAAIAGHGFAVLNPMMWQSEIRAGLLVDPIGRHVLDPASLWLVCPEHRRGVPKVRAFRDWLIPAIRQSVPPELAAILTPPAD